MGPERGWEMKYDGDMRGGGMGTEEELHRETWMLIHPLH